MVFVASSTENEGYDSSLSDIESEHSDHNTASEQSVSEQSEAEIAECLLADNFYLGKDKETRWGKHLPRRPRNVRTGARNIISHPPRGIAKNVDTILESWKMFFPANIVEEIVDYTNKYLTKMRQRVSRPRDCLNTTLKKMYAFLHLMYIAGLKKAQHLNLQELWVDDWIDPDCFRAPLSIKRFATLLRALRFDELDTREARKKVDNWSAIRNIFEEFVTKCSSYYHVGEYITIDKVLEAFRGRCEFRQ
ncbi:hypothetical protein PR048_019307 [Dryococelus australis]|uniref:PiggyBac transposable element-derived protein domain-containing protein n=1 Tax=Dryococelus australis TaxID=614101 RepID=A0ABQ9H3G8_9NEOP|nr:hypothetical protein PR048_019307 [Dryococelus australis]